MSSKKSSYDNIHPSRHQNVHHSTARPAKRTRPKPSDQASQHTHNVSVNKLKGKVRDLTRLLERSERLPADVRIEKERALAGYRLDLGKAQEEKRRKDIIGRYHMVRFFERQKATRVLKKLQAHASTLSPSSPDYASSQNAIHDAEVDLNYTMFYPLTQKYQSLYPRTGSVNVKDDQEPRNREEREADSQRPLLWGLVEQSMSDGTLEGLRDGKLGTKVITEEPKSNVHIHKARTAKYKKRSINTGRGGVGSNGGQGEVHSKDKDMPNEEMSDGGFFEE